MTMLVHCFLLGSVAFDAKDIVADAEERGCFYNGNDDKDLAATISNDVTGVDSLLEMENNVV
jgi:hypothetical protein